MTVSDPLAPARLLRDLRAPDAALLRAGEFEIIPNLQAVRDRLDTIAEATRYEVVSIQPGGGRTAESLRASSRADLSALGRGVDLRILYAHAARGHRPTTHYARQVRSAGGDVRATAHPTGRLIIVDRRVAILPKDPADPDAAALFITGASVAGPLRSLFAFEWRRSQAFVRDESALSPFDWDVLHHLARGVKDEVIGRQLNVSVRTVRRSVAHIIDHLGAKSRFEAGILAAQRGWI